MLEFNKYKGMPVGLSRVTEDVALDEHDEELPMFDVVVGVSRCVFIL